MADVSLAILLDRFVRRMHVALRDKSPAFDTEGVGPTGGMILLTMAELGCVPMQDVTNRFGRDKSQMTRAIQSLERKGLVARVPSQADRRVVFVRLTPPGEAFVDTLRAVISQTIDEILEPISPEERQYLKNVLSRVKI
ncbi:MAG: MarR family transcriptional regulator [Pseudomonadota bacterium]